MFGRLMPKDGKYFDLFNAHAALVVEGGNALHGLVEALVNRPSEIVSHVASIDDIEKKADQITKNTLAKLHSSFITPFDRDEIHELIKSMDDILDAIHNVAESTTIYDISALPLEVMAITKVTVLCCNSVEVVVKLLHSMENSQEILRICHEISDLESDADWELRTIMSKLFREEHDPREIIKLKEIYEYIECVSDRCKDVATTIEAIVFENS